MALATSRDLRNHTSEILQRAALGETVTITVHGSPIAELGPIREERPLYFRRADLIARLLATQADPGLATVLSELAGEMTDESEAL